MLFTLYSLRFLVWNSCQDGGLLNRDVTQEAMFFWVLLTHMCSMRGPIIKTDFSVWQSLHDWRDPNTDSNQFFQQFWLTRELFLRCHVAQDHHTLLNCECRVAVEAMQPRGKHLENHCCSWGSEKGKEVGPWAQMSHLQCKQHHQQWRFQRTLLQNLQSRD